MKTKHIKKYLILSAMTTTGVLAGVLYQNFNQNQVIQKIYNNSPKTNKDIATLSTQNLINPQSQFSTEASERFINVKVALGSEGAIWSTDSKGSVISNNVNHNIANRGAFQGSSMRDDDMEYHFWIQNEKNGHKVDNSDAYYYVHVDDHGNDGGVHATWNLNNVKVNTLQNNYTIRVQFNHSWSSTDMGDGDITLRNNRDTFSDMGNDGDYGGGTNGYEILDSSSFKAMVKDNLAPSNDDYNWIEDGVKLNKITFPFYHYFLDDWGYNWTRPEIEGWDNNIWTATYNKQDTHSALKNFDVDANSALNLMFVPLLNSTQQKDLAHQGNYWTDSSVPPSLHFGLNNELLKAYEETTWGINAIGDVNKDATLSSDQKNTLIELIRDYKLNQEEYDDTKQKIVNHEDVSSYKVKDWAIYAGASYSITPIVGGGNGQVNILNWLRQKNAGYTNYQLLSSFLNKAKSMHLDYNVNGNSKTMELTPTDLIDMEIKAENTSTSQMYSTIKINFIDIQYDISHYINNLPWKQVVPSKLTPDYSKYYIDYNSATSTYSVFYQPNPLDIGTGIYLYPVGQSAKRYDVSFNEETQDSTGKWIATGDKAFHSFYYKTTEGGKQISIPFIQTTSTDWDLKNWSMTAPVTGTTIETLNQYLTRTGKTYDPKSVWYIFNEQVALTINPYQTYDVASGYWKTETFHINSVTDTTEDGHVTTLADFTNPTLSNLFNNGFGMDRNGKPNVSGLLTEGFHSLNVSLLNYGQNDQYFNLCIDTTEPAPKVETTKELGDDQKYYKDENGNYQKLYTSTAEVATSLEDTNIKSAKLSWVDSEGYWYTRELPISLIVKGKDYIEHVLMTIDFQGLFKLEYTDTAGNTNKSYLWIQKPVKDNNGNVLGQTLIANATLGFDGNQGLLATGTRDAQNNPFYWINDTFNNQPPSDLEIHNTLTDKIVEEEYDKATGQWITPTTPSIMTTAPEQIKSVGNSINSGQQTHTLMGDEVAPLLDSSTTKSTVSTNTFYQTKVGAGKGLRRFKVDTNIYTFDSSSGSYTPYVQMVYVLNGNTYDDPVTYVDSSLTWGNGLKVTESNVNASFDSNFTHSTQANEQIDSSSSNTTENSWKYFKSQTIVPFTSSFVKPNSLKVTYSKLWYSYYTPIDCLDTQGLHFNEEGKYHVEYVDLAGNKHQFNALVFDYPRDFEKYTVTHDIDDNGSKKTITEEFYKNPAIAKSQENQNYEIKGTTGYLPYGLKTESGDDLLSKVALIPVSYKYDLDFEEPLNDVNEFKDATGRLPSWLKIEDTGKEDTSGDDPIKIYHIHGQGTTTSALPLPSDVRAKSETTSYQVDAIFSQSSYKEISNALHISAVPVGNISLLTPSELNATSYYTGDYIDLYELSNHNQYMLVDDDQDDSTPKVHLLEDKDHFEVDYAEYIAKGGNPDDYWWNKFNNDVNNHKGQASTSNNGQGTWTHFDFSKDPLGTGTWTPPDNVGNGTGPTNWNSSHHDSSGKSTSYGAIIGGVFGGLFGFGFLSGTAWWSINKRRLMSHGKTLKGNKKKVVTTSKAQANKVKASDVFKSIKELLFPPKKKGGK